MEDMVKRLESGADLVVAEQVETAGPRPRALRWVRRWTPRLLRVRGVRDTISGFLALRLITLRQALRQDGERGSRAAAPPLLVTDGWCANAELLARLTPHARRTETVPVTGRYDLQQRPSRVRPWPTLLAAWRARPVIRAAGGAAVALLALLALAGRLDAQNSATATTSVTAAVAEPARESVSFPIGERSALLGQVRPVLRRRGDHGGRRVSTRSAASRPCGSASTSRVAPCGTTWTSCSSRGWGAPTSARDATSTIPRSAGASATTVTRSSPIRATTGKRGVDSAKATVPDPLDDAAFLYWVRTLPLEVGKRYEYQRYFRPDRNPVIIVVEKKERISVAGRKFNAIVIRPIIPKGRGIFAEQAEAHMWLSDDAQRMMLAMQSNFSFGTVTLKLKEFSVPEHP